MKKNLQKPLTVQQVDVLLDTLEERIANLLAGVTVRGALPPSAREEAVKICEAAANGEAVELSGASQDALVFLLGAIGACAVDLERGTVSRVLAPCCEPALALLARVVCDRKG